MKKIAPCPFVQPLRHAFQFANLVFIVTDLYIGGDLLFHLMNHTDRRPQAGFSEAETRVVLAELTLALVHVHSHGYVHQDIKAENVMLDSVGHVKLIDFGLAAELLDEVIPMEPVGSLMYMSPELVGSKSGGRHTDWWAVGVLMYELLTCQNPWLSSSTESKEATINDILTQPVIPPAHISAQASDFMGSLLEKQFSARLGTASDAEVKAATFFESINWEKTERFECSPAFEIPGRCFVAEEKSEALRTYLELTRRSENVVHSPTSSLRLDIAPCLPLVKNSISPQLNV